MSNSIKSYQKIADKYGDIIRRYKMQYPELSDVKLAKKIVSGEKLEYSSDSFRVCLPYVREINKNVSLDDEIFTIEIPDSHYEERKRFIIPTAIDRLLFISDIHIPYHDINAVKLAIRYGYDHGMRGIFLGGDIIDFYGISRYQRLPHLRHVKSDVELTRQFLYNLRHKFPDLEIYYKIGNHEARWTNYLMSQAPEIFDMDSVQFDDILHLTKLRIRLIDSLQVTEFGRLNILHGHEIMGGGVHVARNFRIKASDNILFGNFHRTKEDITKTIKDKIMGAWAVGCLCGLSPDYMPINDWNLGFAFITREKDGNFSVENKKIINGLVY